MNIRELSVEPRDAVGKGAVGRLRREGRVPAVLYGGGSAPVSLSVSPLDVQRTIQGHGGGGVLVNLMLPGSAEPRTAVVRELLAAAGLEAEGALEEARSPGLAVRLERLSEEAAGQDVVRGFAQGRLELRARAGRIP